MRNYQVESSRTKCAMYSVQWTVGRHSGSQWGNDVTLNLNRKRNNKRHHCVGVEWVVVGVHNYCCEGRDEWNPFNWFPPLLLLLLLLVLLSLLSLCLPLFRRLHELIGAHHVARGLLHGTGAQVYGRHALEHCHCVLLVLVVVGGLSLFLLLLLLCCFCYGSVFYCSIRFVVVDVVASIDRSNWITKQQRYGTFCLFSLLFSATFFFNWRKWRRQDATRLLCVEFKNRLLNFFEDFLRCFVRKKPREMIIKRGICQNIYTTYVCMCTTVTGILSLYKSVDQQLLF